jgi:hypothetical protein
VLLVLLYTRWLSPASDRAPHWCASNQSYTNVLCGQHGSTHAAELAISLPRVSKLKCLVSLAGNSTPHSSTSFCLIRCGSTACGRAGQPFRHCVSSSTSHTPQTVAARSCSHQAPLNHEALYFTYAGATARVVCRAQAQVSACQVAPTHSAVTPADCEWLAAVTPKQSLKYT